MLCEDPSSAFRLFSEILNQLKANREGGWSPMKWAFLMGVQSLPCLSCTLPPQTHTHTHTAVWIFWEDDEEKRLQWWLGQQTLAMYYIITTSNTKGPIFPWTKSLLNFITAERSRGSRQTAWSFRMWILQIAPNLSTQMKRVICQMRRQISKLCWGLSKKAVWRYDATSCKTVHCCAKWQVCDAFMWK